MLTRTGDCIARTLSRTQGHTNSYTSSFQCAECYRSFKCQNELTHHRQVHLERNVACPICGDRRFKSVTNAVQHVEGGACSGCRGVDNARLAIYEFAQARTPNLLNQQALAYGGGGYGGASSMPDEPYGCPDCGRTFRDASALMQHASAKHRTNQSHHLMIGY